MHVVLVMLSRRFPNTVARLIRAWLHHAVPEHRRLSQRVWTIGEREHSRYRSHTTDESDGTFREARKALQRRLSAAESRFTELVFNIVAENTAQVPLVYWDRRRFENRAASPGPGTVVPIRAKSRGGFTGVSIRSGINMYANAVPKTPPELGTSYLTCPCALM